MITLRIDNLLHLAPLGGLSGKVATQIKDRLTFPNPAFLEAEKRGFWTGNLDQEIKGYQVEGDRLTMPRGFTRQLVGILHAAPVSSTRLTTGGGPWLRLTSPSRAHSTTSR